MAVAEAIEHHLKITKDHLPSLPSFQDHDLAEQQMTGFGGMLSIEVEGGQQAAEKVADSLNIFLLATSLGGVESRSEEHTSELQSRENLVCRLLLEKKKTRTYNNGSYINT